MRYPYDLFLRFLVTRKADVNLTLERLGLPELTETEVLDKSVLAYPMPKSVRSFYQAEAGSEIEDKEAFIEWTHGHNVRELWEIQPEYKHSDLRKLTANSTDMKDACDIFATPRIRTAFSLLVLQKFTTDEIVDTIGGHFELSLSAASINLAIKYFFDFTRLSPQDLHHLIHTLPAEQRDQYQLATKAQSREYTEFVIGKLPKLTFEEILHDIMVNSYYKFKSLVDQPLMDGMAQQWAVMAMNAGEKKARWTKGDRTDIVEDIQLRFNFDQPEFPTLAQLSTGNSDSQG